MHFFIYLCCVLFFVCNDAHAEIPSDVNIAYHDSSNNSMPSISFSIDFENNDLFDSTCKYPGIDVNHEVEETPQESIKNFCNRMLYYLTFTPDWSTPKDALNTLYSLEDELQQSRKLRYKKTRRLKEQIEQAQQYWHKELVKEAAIKREIEAREEEKRLAEEAKKREEAEQERIRIETIEQTLERGLISIEHAYNAHAGNKTLYRIKKAIQKIEKGEKENEEEQIANRAKAITKRCRSPRALAKQAIEKEKISAELEQLEVHTPRRIEALKKAKSEIFRTRLVKRALHESASTYIKNRQLLQKLVRSTAYNAVEQNIHEETVEMVNDALDIRCTNQEISHIVDIAINTADVVLDLKVQRRYEQAYSFIDFCTGLINTTKEIVTAIPMGIWDGIVNLGKTGAVLIDSVATDPFETTRTIYNGIIDRVKKTGIQLATALCPDSIVDKIRETCPEAYEESMEEIQRFTSYLASFRDTPGEATQTAVAFATEFWATLKLAGITHAKAAAFKQALSNGLRYEATKLATNTARAEIAGFTSEIAPRSVITPLTSTLENACEVQPVDKTLFNNFIKISQDLRHTTGNFTFNGVIVTAEEAEAIGKAWVGRGATFFSNAHAEGWTREVITPDYVIKRTYRRPTIKNCRIHNGKNMANFEEYIRRVALNPKTIEQDVERIIAKHPDKHITAAKQLATKSYSSLKNGHLEVL